MQPHRSYSGGGAATGHRVHTSLRSYAGDALRAMATTSSTIPPGERQHQRRTTSNNSRAAVGEGEDSLIEDLATLSGQLAQHHYPDATRRRSDHRQGGDVRSRSRSPYEEERRRSQHQPRTLPQGMQATAHLATDLANLSAVAEVPPNLAPNVLLSGSHAVRIRVRLESIWDELHSSLEMRAAMEWHLASLSALEERWAIASSARDQQPTTSSNHMAYQPKSVFRSAARGAQGVSGYAAPPMTSTHESPEMIERDVKLHLFYLEEHLSLLLEEQKLHRAIRDKLAYRTRLMEQLKLCASKYRSTITQHILIAHQQVAKAPYPSLFSAPRHVGPSSSTIVHNVLQEVHHLLDAYRLVTVEVVELHTQWRNWILSGNFFGAASRLPASSEKWEASVPAGSTKDGLLGPVSAPLPAGAEQFFYHHAVPQEFYKRAYKTRSREAFTVTPNGLPLLVYMCRDLFLKSFIGEPLCVLLGLSIDWNPFALPGQHWSIVGPTVEQQTSSHASHPTAEAKEKLLQQQRDRMKMVPSKRSHNNTTALSSLFSKYAKDHRWRALIAPSAQSVDASESDNDAAKRKQQYLTFFAKEHSRLLQGGGASSASTTPRGNSWAPPPASGGRISTISAIQHHHQSTASGHYQQHSSSTSFAPGTFVVPSALFRYAEGRSATVSSWPPHHSKRTREDIAAERRISGFSTDVEEQYDRCAVALATMKREVEQRSIVRIQALVKGVHCRQVIWEQLTATVTMQRMVRGMLGRIRARRAQRQLQRRGELVLYLRRRNHSSSLLLMNSFSGEPNRDATKRSFPFSELECMCIDIAAHVIGTWLLYRHRRLKGRRARVLERVRRLQQFGRQVLIAKATRRCMKTLKRVRNMQIRLQESESPQRQQLVTTEAHARQLLCQVVVAEMRGRIEVSSSWLHDTQALATNAQRQRRSADAIRSILALETGARLPIAESETLQRSSILYASHREFPNVALLNEARSSMRQHFQNDLDSLCRLQHWFRAQVLIPLYFLRTLDNSHVNGVVALWDEEIAAFHRIEEQWTTSFAQVEQRVAANMSSEVIQEALDETQKFDSVAVLLIQDTKTQHQQQQPTTPRGQSTSSAAGAFGGSPSIQFLRSMFPSETATTTATTTSTVPNSTAAPSLGALVEISSTSVINTTAATTTTSHMPPPPPPPKTPTRQEAAPSDNPSGGSPSINFLRGLFPTTSSTPAAQAPPASPSLNVLAVLSSPSTAMMTPQQGSRASPPPQQVALPPKPPASFDGPVPPPISSQPTPAVAKKGYDNLGPIPPPPPPKKFDDLGPVPPPSPTGPVQSAAAPQKKFDNVGPVPPPPAAAKPPQLQYDNLGPVPPPVASPTKVCDNLGPVPPPAVTSTPTANVYDNLGLVPPPSPAAPAQGAAAPQKKFDNLGPVPPPPPPPTQQQNPSTVTTLSSAALTQQNNGVSPTNFTPPLMSTPTTAQKDGAHMTTEANITSPSLQFLRHMFPAVPSPNVSGEMKEGLGGPSIGEIVRIASAVDAQKLTTTTPSAPTTSSAATKAPLVASQPPPPLLPTTTTAISPSSSLTEAYKSLPDFALRALLPHLLKIQRASRGASARKLVGVQSSLYRTRRKTEALEQRARLELLESLQRLRCAASMSWSGVPLLAHAALQDPQRPLYILRNACASFAFLQRSKQVEAARRELQRTRRLGAAIILRPFMRQLLRSDAKKQQLILHNTPQRRHYLNDTMNVEENILEALQELQSMALSLMASVSEEELERRTELLHFMVYHRGDAPTSAMLTTAAVTAELEGEAREAEQLAVKKEEAAAREVLLVEYLEVHRKMQSRLLAALDVGIRLRREVLAEVLDRNCAAAVLQRGVKRWVLASWVAVQVQRNMRQMLSAKLVARFAKRASATSEASENTLRWAAVRVIASFWLRKSTRRRALRLREEEQTLNSQRHAVSVIQHAMQRWKASLSDAEQRARHIKSAIKLGASINLDSAHYQAAVEAAAIRLQCFYRSHKAARIAEKLRVQESEALAEMERDRAVRGIQLLWRRAIERKRTAESVTSSRIASAMPSPITASNAQAIVVAPKQEPLPPSLATVAGPPPPHHKRDDIADTAAVASPTVAITTNATQIFPDTSVTVESAATSSAAVPQQAVIINQNAEQQQQQQQHQRVSVLDSMSTTEILRTATFVAAGNAAAGLSSSIPGGGNVPHVAPSSLPIPGKLRAPQTVNGIPPPPLPPAPTNSTIFNNYHNTSVESYTSTSTTADTSVLQPTPAVVGVVSGKLRGSSPRRPNGGMEQQAGAAGGSRVAEPQHPSFSSTTFAAPLQQQRADVVAGQLREDHQHLSSAASAPNVSTGGATTAVGAPNIIAAPLASHRHNNPPPSAPPVLQSTSTATPPAPVDVLADHRAPLPSLVNPSEQEDDLFNMLTGVNPHAHRTSTTTTTVTTTTSSLTTNQNPTISNVNHVAASGGTTVAPLPPPAPPTIHPNAQVPPQHATTTTVNDSISTVDSLPTPPPSPPLKLSSSGQHVMSLHVAPPLSAHDVDDADALDWDQVLLPKMHQTTSQHAGEADRVPLDSARSTIPELTDEAYDDGHSQAVVAHVPLARPAIENNTDRNDDASLEESLQGDEPISVVVKKTIATSQMSTRTTTMIQPSSKNAPPRFTSEAVVGAGGLSLTPRLTFDALRKYGPSAQQPTPSAAVLQSSSTSIVSSSSRWEGAGRVAPLRALVRNQSATYGDNNNIGELMDESVVLSSAAVAVYDAPAQKMRPSVQQQHRVDPFALVTTSVTAPSEMDDTTSSLPDLDDWSQQAASGAVHSTFVAAERGRITTHQPSQPLHAVHVAPSLTVSGTVNSTIQQQLSLQLPTLHQKLRSHKLHHSSLLNESDALDVTLSEASLNSSLRSNSSLQDQYYKTNKNAPDGFISISHPHHNSSSPPMATHYAPPSPSLAKAAQQRQEVALGHDFPRRSMEGVLHQSSPQWTTSSARTHPSQLSHALSQSQQQRDDMSPLQQTSHQYSVVVAGTPSRVPQHQPHPSPSREHMSSSMVLSSSLNVSSPYNSSTWTAAHHGSGERRAPPQYYDGPDVQSQQRMLHNAPPPPPPSLAAVVASSPSSSYQSPSQYYNAANTHRLHHDGHAYELPHQQTMATPTGAASRYLPNITVDPPSSPRGSPRRRIAPNRSPGSGVSDFLTPGGGRGKSNSQQRQSNEFLSPMRRPSDMMHSAERNRRILQRHLFSGDDD